MIEPDGSRTFNCAEPRAWLERYGDGLYRFALARVRDPGAAEDLVQETLLAAWAGRDSFKGDCAERTWLTAILKHKVVNWLRKRVRERLRTTEGTGAAGDEFEDGLFNRRGIWRRSVQDRMGDPAWPAEREEFWAALRGCVGQLPPRLRDIFVLRYLDEAAAAEVCRELGLSEANLWTMLRRARLRVGACLAAGWMGGEPGTGGGR